MAAAKEPHSISLSKETTSARIKPRSKSEWILPAAARALVDEGVFEVAAEVLRRHDDTEVLRYLCATLAKVVRFDRPMCLLHHR